MRKGTWVKDTGYGHIGIVYDTDTVDKTWNDWLNYQEIQPTQEEIDGVWLRVLVHEGGSVCVPASRCVEIEPIENFEHSCVADHFPELVK